MSLPISSSGSDDSLRGGMRQSAAMPAAHEHTPRSLYVHVPFCAHRCGYCDFVTTSRSPELHERYVAALQRELAMRGGAPDGGFDTIYVGGGTPTLLEPGALDALLAWTRGMSSAEVELTLECNPETVTPQLAQQLVSGGVSRVSLGAQSLSPAVLTTLERRATPDDVRRAVDVLRSAGLERLSLDLIWGVPGQTLADVRRDLSGVLSLSPDHVSAYELEFKPGTRLAHAFGTDRDAAVGDASDEFYDLVVDTFEHAGWRWYETANFARTADERCRHNLAYWRLTPWQAVGVGAVATLDAGSGDGALWRRTNLPNVPRYLAALDAETAPPARDEHVDVVTARVEQLMLALRLDEPVRVGASDIADGIVDAGQLERLSDIGLLDARIAADDDGVHRGSVDIALTRRGRMLQAGVAGELLRM